MGSESQSNVVQPEVDLDLVHGVVVSSVGEPVIGAVRTSAPPTYAPSSNRDTRSLAEDDVPQHPDLNKVRSMLVEQQRREQPRADEVAVTRDATIVIGNDVASQPGTTRVEPGTFASGPVDLNRIREHFHATQRAMASGQPQDPEKTVGVTRSGQIVTGSSATGAQGVTRVEPGTFAAAMSDAQRATYEARVARERLPANAQPFDGGWTYSFTTQYGTEFTIYTRWNGVCYESWLVNPERQRVTSAHEGHLFSNGKMCLSDTPGSGQPTLEEAYSKSVIWAHGFDVVNAGYDFPFSINNL